MKPLQYPDVLAYPSYVGFDYRPPVPEEDLRLYFNCLTGIPIGCIDTCPALN